MKYKDIYDLFAGTDRTVGVKMAVRVSFCQPYVKTAVNKWLESGIEPDLTVELFHKDKTLEISAQALIHEFGMQPLDALLFIDWANRSNKEDMIAAVTALRFRTIPDKIGITEEIMKKIPDGVIREYEKIKETQAKNFQKLEKIYAKIENAEIDE